MSTFLLNSATLEEKRSFPSSAAGRKVGRAGVVCRILEVLLDVVGKPGAVGPACGLGPSFGGQQEHGIPGKQVPRDVLLPNHPGGKLKKSEIKL